MSYCRFSSDDYQSDVYCYEDCYSGFTTHVASRRYVYDRDALPEVKGEVGSDEWKETYFARYEAQMAAVKDAPLVPIGLPHDGAQFTDPDPSSTADRLEMLREAGYVVPQYAIDALREEAETWSPEAE